LGHLREVSIEKARKYCEENSLSLVETSAKDNTGVDFAFQKLIGGRSFPLLSFFLSLSIHLLNLFKSKQNILLLKL
jgi:hypothetical protein